MEITKLYPPTNPEMGYFPREEVVEMCGGRTFIKIFSDEPDCQGVLIGGVYIARKYIREELLTTTEDQNLVFCRRLFMTTKAKSSWEGGLCCWSSPSLFLGGDRYFEVYVSHAAPAHIRKKYDYMLWQGHASNAWAAKTNFLNEFDRKHEGDFVIEALRSSYGDEWVDGALRKGWVTPDGQASNGGVRRLIERALKEAV